MDASNSQLCRICVSSSGNCTQMISIFGEDSLWKKITTLADVKIEKGDTLPQQVCINCAKNTISACLFKKKCEDADNFFRQQLLIQKIEGQVTSSDENKINTTETETEENDTKHTMMMMKGQAHMYDDRETSALPNNSSEDEHENSNDSSRIGSNRCNGVDNNGHHHHHHHQRTHEHEIIGEDGEIKSANGVEKPPFDFHSIRLMHEYMQQQLSKFNGAPTHNDGSHSPGSASDGNADDEEPLPLIPEIELLTPSEDMLPASNGSGSTVGTSATGAPLRGYQCPNCFQIFEMKQILKAHMQSVHGTAGPVYECSNCKKTYFYKRFLEKHVRRGRCVKKRRNQTRPMQCSDCHVLFPTGHHLGWHKRTGCPSRAAKMPLQQLFKQNIVQYNNFPKRIGIRKPENAIYLHNRKLMMANKRKGRTRIKLDAKKIALAKQLILREATTTVIANELNISRTFAWRLRKSLVNGVSLHERVIDPNCEEAPESSIEQQQQQQQQLLAQEQEKFNQQEKARQEQHIQESVMNIKSEEDDDDDCDEDDNDNDDIDEDEGPLHEDEDIEADGEEEEIEDQQHPAAKLLMNQMDEHMTLADQYSQLHHTAAEVEVGGEDYEKDINDSIHDNGETGTDGDDANDEVQLVSSTKHQQQQQQQQQQQHKHQQREQQKIFLQNMALHGVPSEKVVEAAAALKDLKFQKNFMNGGNGLPLVMPPLHQFPAGITTPLNQLPVNLSIRPIASLQKKELISPSSASSINNMNQTKKPRKPNVFIDDEKYAMAQTLVAQNASTMEIARALNVSQMTAWKVRDAIIKGVPLSYRNKRGDIGLNRIPSNIMKPDENSNEAQESNSVELEAQIAKEKLRLQQQHMQQQLQQQQEHQQKLLEQQLREKQQQQKQLELLQRQQIQQQQQLQQQKLLLQEQQRRREQQQQQEEEQQPFQQHRPQHQLQQQLQHTIANNTLQQHQHSNNMSTSNDNNINNTNANNSGNTITKLIHPRRRLKAAEREQRDKEITREILELIKEDSNIQYWKVSARLAEKGYPISPSSVCQKLKSMGIHRRWKPGDKPPLMLAPGDMEQIKTNLNASAATSVANSSSADESYDQQFELGGAHFLSAFTR